MEDHEIVELYWSRAEEAIGLTAEKYGAYCVSIARNILGSQEDGEECAADAYFRVWNAIPPQRPKSLKLFLGRVTRNLALDRLRAAGAEKRGGGQANFTLEELKECVSGGEAPESVLEGKLLTAAINTFLWQQSPENRKIFVSRYWYLESISEIAEKYGVGVSKVKSSLSRTRKRLKQYLTGRALIYEGR